LAAAITGSLKRSLAGIAFGESVATKICFDVWPGQPSDRRRVGVPLVDDRRLAL
jgi:hypothetical protein